MAAAKPAPVRHTEDSMLGLLRRRYMQDSGNGPAWVLVPRVRNQAGFDANRTADAVAMSLWPSRGLELHGFEIKCSRSDWVRERDNPAKAEAFSQYVDRWWLVVADKAMVHEGELPPTWGLLAPVGGSLKAVKDAPRLRHAIPVHTPAEGTVYMPTDLKLMRQLGTALPPGFGRSFLAALLRSAARTHQVTPEEVQQGIDAATARHQAMQDEERQAHADEVRKLHAVISEFEVASGLALRDRSYYGKPVDVAALGAKVRAVLDGDKTADDVQRRVGSLANSLERMAAELRALAPPEDLA